MSDKIIEYRLKSKFSINVHIKIEKDLMDIYFSGTTGIGQWIMNFFILSIFKVQAYKNMPVVWKIPIGFYYGYHGIRDEIHRIIQRHKIKRILCLGYSRGAAIASLFIEDIYFTYKEKIAFIITPRLYGAPKILDSMGRWLFQTRGIAVHNFVYGNDIVTKCIPGKYYPWKPIYMGPVRTWYKVSCKDHTRYSVS